MPRNSHVPEQERKAHLLKDNTRRRLLYLSYFLLLLFCLFGGYVGTVYPGSRGMLALLIAGMLLALIVNLVRK